MSGSNQGNSSDGHSPEPRAWDRLWGRRGRSGSLRGFFGRLSEGENIDDLFKSPHHDAEPHTDDLQSDDSDSPKKSDRWGPLSYTGREAAARRAELRKARRRPSPTPFSGFFHHKEALDRGLASLQNGLGMTNNDSTTFSDDDEPIIAKATASIPSTLIYAPDMDGQADSGEVVWIRGLLAAQPDREMPVVILGHHGHHFRALLISTNQQCASDDHWFDIGSGGWDMQGRQAWVRLDKTLEVPEHKIRRRGTVIPRHRFNRIAQRLRADYNWR